MKGLFTVFLCIVAQMRVDGDLRNAFRGEEFGKRHRVQKHEANLQQEDEAERADSTEAETAKADQVARTQRRRVFVDFLVGPGIEILALADAQAESAHFIVPPVGVDVGLGNPFARFQDQRVPIVSNHDAVSHDFALGKFVLNPIQISLPDDYGHRPNQFAFRGSAVGKATRCKLISIIGLIGVGAFGVRRHDGNG